MKESGMNSRGRSDVNTAYTIKNEGIHDRQRKNRTVVESLVSKD